MKQFIQEVETGKVYEDNMLVPDKFEYDTFSTRYKYMVDVIRKYNINLNS